MYESATLRERGRISRQSLAEHRGALMGIAWAYRCTHHRLSNATPRSVPAARLRSRPVSRNACRLIHRMHVTRQPFGEAVSSRRAQRRTMTATLVVPLDGATSFAARSRWAALYGTRESLPTKGA